MNAFVSVVPSTPTSFFRSMSAPRYVYSSSTATLGVSFNPAAAPSVNPVSYYSPDPRQRQGMKMHGLSSCSTKLSSCGKVAPPKSLTYQRPPSSCAGDGPARSPPAPPPRAPNPESEPQPASLTASWRTPATAPQRYPEAPCPSDAAIRLEAQTSPWKGRTYRTFCKASVHHPSPPVRAARPDAYSKRSLPCVGQDGGGDSPI
jgi:hypothetical protein